MSGCELGEAADDAYARRLEAVVAGHRGEAEVAERLLCDSDAAVRAAALGALARCGELDVAQVRRALADDAAAVRCRAAELAPAEVELVGLLGDPDASVVEAAAAALGERDRDPGPVEELCQVARGHDDPLCRESAVAALGAIAAGLDADAEAVADAGANAGSGTDTDATTDSSTGTGTGTDATTDSSTGSGTGTDATTDSSTGTGTDTDATTDATTDSSTGTGTDTDATTDGTDSSTGTTDTDGRNHGHRHGHRHRADATTARAPDATTDATTTRAPDGHRHRRLDGHRPDATTDATTHGHRHGNHGRNHGLEHRHGLGHWLGRRPRC